MTFVTVPLAEDLLQLRASATQWPSPSNVYLVRTVEGAALVDSGLGIGKPYEELLRALNAALAGWGLKLADLHSIVLTHTHADHAGGALPLHRLSGASIRLPEAGWAQASQASWQVHHILPAEVRAELAPDIRQMDLAAHFRSQCMPELFGAARLVQFLRDGERLTFGAWSFDLHHVPGHDVGLLLLHDARRRVAISADLLAAPGTALPWYPPNAGGVEAYLASLERTATLDIALLCPGHGAVLAGAEEIGRAIHRTASIILKRDLAIIQGLRRANASFGVLDDLIYPSKVREVIPWASSVTWTHLRRLERLGVLHRLEGGDFTLEPLAATRYESVLHAALDAGAQEARLLHAKVRAWPAP